MKKIIFSFSLAAMTMVSAVKAQEGASQTYADVFSSDENNSQLGAVANLTQIGDETYVGLRIRPEIVIKKFGIGLDIPLIFNAQDGSFRTEEYLNGVGLARIIRYVRYGVKKKDPVYVRLGDITGTYLGFGGLVNNYSNSASFERRKIGLSWDILIKKKYGIEGFYSDIDFTSPNLFGLRPYAKPLVGVIDVPIIKTTEVGFTFVQDKDNTKSQYDEDGNATRSELLDKSVRAWGIDIGWDILKTKIINVKAFAQYSKLAENAVMKDTAKVLGLSYGAGHGRSIGARANMSIGGDFLNLNARLERLWYSENYIPQFFDAIYEINKDQKLFSLITAEEQAGIYGTLTGTILSKIKLGGALLLPDNVSETSPAYIRFDAAATNLANKVSLTGTYMKGGITDMSDALKIDERSLANARLTYKVSKLMVAGVDYRWTFTKKDDGKIEAVNYVMPYFGLSMPLGGK